MFEENSRIKEMKILPEGKVKIVVQGGDKIILDRQDTQYVADMVKTLERCDAPPEAISECVFDFIKQLIFVNKLSEEEKELYFTQLEEEHELLGEVTLEDVASMTPEERELQVKSFEEKIKSKLN